MGGSSDHLGDGRVGPDRHSSRPERRHGSGTRHQAFLECQLLSQHGQARGVLCNLSLQGAYLRVRADDPATEWLGIGARPRLEFTPSPSETPLHSEVEVRWTRGSEFGPGGWPAMALGVRFTQRPPGFTSRLRPALDRLRYVVCAYVSDAVTAEVVQQALGEAFSLRCFSDWEGLLAAPETGDAAALLVQGDLAAMGEQFRELVTRVPVGHVLHLASADEPTAPLTFIELGLIVQRLPRPIDPELLQRAVQRAVEFHSQHETEQRRSRELTDQLHEWRSRFIGGDDSQDALREIVGCSAAMRRTVAMLHRVGQSDARVHIRGETGTGKELFVRALHRISGRRDGPLIVHNCAGTNDQLTQSILFGHVRGAFTGAERDHAGVFRLAHGGTLLLDEVGELSPAIQAAVLRVLQDGRVTSVGASKAFEVDVRVVSATHRDLRTEIEAGRFREDLFHRLVVIQLDIPPLRRRREDIPLLAQHFLHLARGSSGKSLPGFAAEALRLLEAYDWPGNVRELRNEVERLAVVARQGEYIGAGLLSSHLVRRHSSATEDAVGQEMVSIPLDGTYDEVMSTVQTALVTRALQRANGVVATAASMLGMERSRLAKLKKRLGL